MEEFDKDNDGQINFAEFKGMMLQLHNQQHCIIVKQEEEMV